MRYVCTCKYFLQVSNCQWTLDVTLHKFELMYNIERSENGKFCCCDDDETCKKDPSDSKLQECPSEECDIYFDVSVTPCNGGMGQGRCSVSTDQIKDMRSNVGDYGYFFRLTTNAPPDIVSKYIDIPVLKV